MKTGGSCPSGTIEYGSPSECGSQTEYDAYVQYQITKAFGDENKAKQYIQTTQYGEERGFECDYPNVLSFDADGKKDCLSPARYCDRAIAAGGGYKGVVKINSPDGKTSTCFNCSGVAVECPKDYPKTGSTTGGAKTPVKVNPQPIAPVSASVDYLPLLAVAALLGVGGYMVYRKRQKAKGLAKNPYDTYGEDY